MIAGEIFKLKDQIEIPETGVNRKLFYSSGNIRVVLHAINRGEVIQPHPAPGEALVLALEGKAIASYDGKEMAMEKGDSLIFAPGGMHGFTALEPFKFVVFLNRQDS